MCIGNKPFVGKIEGGRRFTKPATLPQDMRETPLPADADNQPLGVALFLSSDDLDELGVDSDDDTLAYGVVDGELRIEGRNTT